MKIVTYPNPVLRAKSEPIVVFDESLLKLVHGMVAAMQKANGIGLAANQVGVAVRVILVEINREVVAARAKRSGTDYRKLLDRSVPLVALVNPELLRSSKELDTATEGCLSLPEIEVEVARPVACKVRAQTLAGKSITIAAKGLYARVLQHEIDHINGVLIIDRGKAEKIKD
ncbi:MAG: peptide deformylase [Patescibacteria group bacterium]